MTSSRLHVVLAVLITFGMACGGGSAPSGGDGALTPTAATPTFSPAAGTYTVAQSVTLSSATTGAAIHYTTDGSAPTASSAAYSAPVPVAASATIKAIAVATGYTDSAIGSAAYVIDLPLPGVAATPTFSPAAGTFTAAQSVVLASTTAGAVIHYTTDGSTPTAASATYSAAIAVAASATVKAIAVATGYTDSAIGSAAYVINVPVPGVAVTPVFSPVAGTYSGAQAVSLSTTTPGAAIHYTIDGTTPTAASATYTAQLTVSTSTTIKAIAVAPGYANSDLGSAAYVITAAVALRGIALPGEVSALPTKGSGSSALRSGALRAGAVSTALASPPAGSDYDKAETFKFVSEQSLAQFDILNTIFTAMAQTHYDDPAVVNQGPYSAMVTWQEKSQQGQDQKQLLKWVVNSTRASETAPNVVKAWFQQSMMDKQLHTIQAQVVIEVAPTQNADGSYTDYGVWRMDVKVFDQMPFRFVATASKDPQGRAVIKMEQSEPGPGGTPVRTQGIVVKSASDGSGKVRYPDRENMMGSGPPPIVEVVYAYNPQIVTLQKDAAAATTKDRNVFVDIVNRYGLFDATTGDDVSRARRFGFPIRATVAGADSFGYYGAWQGRHQIWANGNSSLAPDVTVNRADVPPGTTGAVYTTSPVYTGILVKRSFADAALSDIAGLVVQTWDNESFEIGFDGTKWCTNPMLGYPPGTPPPPGPPPGVCQGTYSADFTDFGRLVSNANDKFRNVMLFQPPTGPNIPSINLVYLSLPDDPGFYEAEMLNGQWTRKDGAAKKVFQDRDHVQVNVGGMIYLSYDSTGWVRKIVDTMDPQTMQATFKAGGDPYALVSGREYYFNNSGTNYIVKKSIDGVTTVQLELQSAANPVNVATIVPAGTVFEQQWCGQGTCSTYEFVTDKANTQKFMKLVFKTVSDADKTSTTPRAVGDVVDFGMFGLKATVAGQALQFNWDYPMGNQMGGQQQFLLDTGGNYVMLDDPIRLDAIEITSAAGTKRTFTLQFDGNWMQGLPGLWDDLRASGFQATEAIKQKAFSVPSATVMGSYIVKQLQVSEYMAQSSAAALDLAEAKGIVLDGNVPQFQPHGMGDIPAGAPLKYSEGKPVAP
jgi:hypothetical protein